MRKLKIIKDINSLKISLTGEYLRENGFEIGDIFSVYISPTEIIIKKGIHSGQNWLRTQYKVGRALKGMGIDVKEYAPRIEIKNILLIDNGYNAGEYLNVDFVSQGVIRLTKVNVDNNIITNNFEYTKDIEIQITNNKNIYFLSLFIYLDKTILSKTDFKEGDILTLCIKGGTLYIKKGKENIPNCYYYKISGRQNFKNNLTIRVVNSEIFKELNLEAGDFVTLKIVSPDILSLTKKDNTGSQIPSVNENKLSSYIRKIVREIINESLK